MGELVGYVRVSTISQNTARQDHALVEAGATKVFTDRASGKNTGGRPELARCLDYLRDGDVLVISSMDRLARSLPDLLSIVAGLTSDGVTVRFLKEGVVLSPEGVDPMSNLLLNLLGAVAQFERELILERQREGIAQARARGAYRGRKPTDPEKIDKVRELVANGVPVARAARQVGVARSVVYRANVTAKDQLSRLVEDQAQAPC